MVAEVSTLIRLMNGSDGSNESSSKSTALITQDLLGGCLDSKELDLDLQVPNGWEKRLDLKTGKVYLERINYSTSTLEHKKQTATKLPLNLFEDTKLELKLQPSSSSSGNYNYHNVCTLEKVKIALERAEKELPPTRKRSSSMSSSSSSSFMSMVSSSSTSYSNSSSIHITNSDEDHMMSSSSHDSVAAGCPSCLIYVLISKANPRCPKCNAIVPMLRMKKPCIDLNISL
ncbi:hypothetical protein BC332_24931 [Capsicum chinense]|nr:hypothetical protein BC332_24931 [Capsicum chinense]